MASWDDTGGGLALVRARRQLEYLMRGSPEISGGNPPLRICADYESYAEATGDLVHHERESDQTGRLSGHRCGENYPDQSYGC